MIPGVGALVTVQAIAVRVGMGAELTITNYLRQLVIVSLGAARGGTGASTITTPTTTTTTTTSTSTSTSITNTSAITTTTAELVRGQN